MMAGAKWNQLLAAYVAAKAAEDDYDAKHIAPHLVGPASEVGPERNAALDAIPKEVWEEAERLQNIRCDVHETALMAFPSPDATAFAFKFLVAYGDGRDANGYNDMLEAEARRFWWGQVHGNYVATRSAFDAAPADTSDEEEERLGSEYRAARNLFMQTPAPTIEGLHAKIAHTFQVEPEVFDEDKAIILADAARLTEEAA